MSIFKVLLHGAGVASLLFFAQQAHSQTPVNLNSAVLPSSRAVVVGDTVTVFGNLINGGDTGATDCSVSILPQGNPAGIVFSYRAFQSDNATPAAPADTPVDVPGHASQAFVLSLTPTNTFSGTDIKFNFACSGGFRASVIKGVNTLFLTSAAVATPDIITIGATPTNDGIVHIASLGGAEVMSVSAVNIGAGAGVAPIIVAPDTGDIPLPLDLFICETDPSTSVCKNPPSTTVSTVIGASASTFAVFANSTRGAGVPNFPDMARLHLRYYDGAAAPDRPQSVSKPAFLPPANAGGVFGATSSGITSPGPDSAAGDTFPTGIWRIRYQNESGLEDAGFVLINENGAINAGLYRANSSTFPDPFDFIFGNFSNTNAPNGSAQRTLDTSFTFIKEDMDGNFVTAAMIGSGLWNPKNNVLVSFIPGGGSSGSPGNYKLVYTGGFDRAVSLAGLAGTYDAIDQDEDTGEFSQIGTLVIAANGTLSGTISPEVGQICTIAGALAPFSGGGNLFDVNTTLSGGNCPITNPLVGQAFVSDIEDPGRGVLINNTVNMVLRFNDNSFAVFTRFVPTGTIPFP
jgi:hypothetical protein